MATSRAAKSGLTRQSARTAWSKHFAGTCSRRNDRLEDLMLAGIVGRLRPQWAGERDVKALLDATRKEKMPWAM